MNILFASTADDPAEWVPALENHIPGCRVVVAPDLGPDPASLDYAVSWAPQPGVLGQAPNLKAVLWLGAGVDRAISDPNLPPDVPLYRLIDPGLTQGMVEYVVEQVMAWHRSAPRYRALQAKSEWDQLRPVLAGQRKIGMLGLGVLGSACAKALTTLGFPVLGWSRTQKEIDGITCCSGSEGLLRLYAEAEIIVCLLPLTPETTGILNKEAFAAMRPGAVVINAGRGAQIVDEDLLSALDDGHLGGASLDVFAVEPLPSDHRYWRHPKVVVTPHVASLTPAETAVLTIAETIRLIEAGTPPADAFVDRSRGY